MTQIQRRLLLTTVVFLTMSLFSSLFSQVIDSKQYNYTGNWYNWQGGRFITNLNIPKVQATTGRDTGAIYYRLADSSIYVWTGSQWLQITGGSGGSGGGVTQFNFTNTTGITGTVTNATTTPTLELSLDSGAIPNFWQKVRSLFGAGYGLNYANGQYWADTSKLASILQVQHRIDSLAGTITNEGTTWGTVVQRLALDTSTLAEGYRYFQTDQLAGNYTFSSAQGWRFNGSADMYVVNDQFNFEAGAVGSQHTASVSGTNAVARVLPFNSVKYDSLFNRGAGIWELATGTTSTGFAAMWTNNSNFGVLRNSRFYSEARIYVDSLSTSTERYLFRLGIKARGSLPADANGAQFIYSDTTASNTGVWLVMTSDGSGNTSYTNTGVTATRGWIKLGVEWFSDVSTATYRAKFYINDVLVGTKENIAAVGDAITTTVEGGSHVTSASIRKLVGSTNRQIFFDYFNCYNLNINQ